MHIVYSKMTAHGRFVQHFEKVLYSEIKEMTTAVKMLVDKGMWFIFKTTKKCGK